MSSPVPIIPLKRHVHHFRLIKAVFAASLFSMTGQRKTMEPHRHDCPEITESGKCLEGALMLLREKGHRITKPRIAILEALIARHGPVAIEELHQSMPGGVCDLATVYRCLAAFEKTGIVRRSYFSEGTAIYEFTLGGDHHHHIICRECHKVEALDFCVVEGLERLVRDRGYEDVSHMLEFFGTCAACAEKTPDGKPSSPPT